MVLCINESNNSPEDHVDGGSVEGRRDEDEDSLEDKGRESIVWFFFDGHISKYVPNGLDCS